MSAPPPAPNPPSQDPSQDPSLAHVLAQLLQTNAAILQTIQTQSAQTGVLIEALSKTLTTTTTPPLCQTSNASWSGSSLTTVWPTDRLRVMSAQSQVYPIKSSISSRTQSGKQFDYMSGETVIDHLNEIFGFNGWSQTFHNMETKMLCTPDTHPKGKPNFKVITHVLCRLTLRDGTMREATGSHEGEMGCLGSCMELSKKAAETDSMKRCARTFGNYFGLACYKEMTKFNAPATDMDRQNQIIDLVKDASAKDIRAGGVVVKTEPAGFSDSSGDTPYNNAMLTHGAASTANNNKRMASPTANHSNKRMAPSPTGLSAVKRAPPKNPYGK